MNPFRTLVTAFTDKRGNHYLEGEKDGASNLFICVVEIVNDGQKKLGEDEMREISRDEFSKEMVESSRIGSNYNRRLRFLNKINKVMILNIIP